MSAIHAQTSHRVAKNPSSRNHAGSHPASETQQLMDSAHLSATGEGLDFRDGMHKVHLDWLKMNPPEMGKALFADRPNLLLSELGNTRVHRIDDNLTGAQLQQLGQVLDGYRHDALDAEETKAAQREARYKEINARLAASAPPPTYAPPVYTGPGSAWAKHLQQAQEADRVFAYDAANSRRSDGSYFNTSTDAASRAGYQQRWNMGDF